MKMFMFLVTVLFVNFGFAHGESEAGPHGGIIRMPGPFHTELKIEGKQLKIWLLDINFKNPTTKDSSVDVVVNKTAKQSCKAEKDYFLCNNAVAVQVKDKVSVWATRDKIVGNEAIYNVLAEWSGKKAETPKATQHGHQQH